MESSDKELLIWIGHFDGRIVEPDEISPQGLVLSLADIE